MTDPILLLCWLSLFTEYYCSWKPKCAYFIGTCRMTTKFLPCNWVLTLSMRFWFWASPKFSIIIIHFKFKVFLLLIFFLTFNPVQFIFWINYQWNLYFSGLIRSYILADIIYFIPSIPGQIIFFQRWAPYSPTMNLLCSLLPKFINSKIKTEMVIKKLLWMSGKSKVQTLDLSL